MTQKYIKTIPMTETSTMPEDIDLLEAFYIGYANFMAGNVMAGENYFGPGMDADAYNSGMEAAMAVNMEARREQE